MTAINVAIATKLLIIAKDVTSKIDVTIANDLTNTRDLPIANNLIIANNVTSTKDAASAKYLTSALDHASANNVTTAKDVTIAKGVTILNYVTIAKDVTACSQPFILVVLQPVLQRAAPVKGLIYFCQGVLFGVAANPEEIIIGEIILEKRSPPPVCGCAALVLSFFPAPK